MQNGVVEVSITRNSASLTLGIIAIVLAVLALLVSWIPFVGLLSIPVAVIGLLLVAIGVLIALLKGGRGIGMPLLGGVLCVIPIAVSVSITSATGAAISESAKEVRTEIDRSRQLKQQLEQQVASQLAIENVKLTKESIFGSDGLSVSYAIRNDSEHTVTLLETRIYFLDANGVEVAQSSDYPVTILDPDLFPGNTTRVEANPYKYSNVPTDLVKSVRIEIKDVTLR